MNQKNQIIPLHHHISTRQDTIPLNQRIMNQVKQKKFIITFFIILITFLFLNSNGRPTESIPLFLSQPGHQFTQTADQNLQVDLSFDSDQSYSFNTPSNFTDLDLNNRILNAAPILGFYNESYGELADWMSAVPDEIPITRLNIPGTHDSATWNYTQSTQDSLESLTGKLPPSVAFQCQDRSLFQMLGDGIRFFDFRVGFLPDHEQLGFYHASALLSSTATLPDVLLGFYKWLNEHPTETILISIKVDNATFQIPPSKNQPSSLKLQQIIYHLLTQSDLARTHWFQQDSQLSTLGESRGKLIFIQRIDWEYIRNDELLKPIGIPLPPAKFEDNNANFIIRYNAPNSNQTSKVYVEDFYNILPNPTPSERKVELKFDAIQSHFQLATSAGRNIDGFNVDQDLENSLFITFTSGGALKNIPPVTPKMLAVGTGEGESLNNSLNNKVLNLIQEKYQNDDQDYKEKYANVRLGIVIFDWYHQLPDLVHSLIALNPSCVSK